MATQTRKSKLFDAWISLVEDTPHSDLKGWFSTGDVQRLLFRKKDTTATAEEVRDLLSQEVENLLLDDYERAADRWALYDPGSVQSLLRLGHRQGDFESLSMEEADYLSRQLTHIAGGDLSAPGIDREADKEAAAGLVEKGVLEEDGGTLKFAGRLGEFASMGGGPRGYFRDLPREDGDYVPKGKWGWRDGGVIFLSDEYQDVVDRLAERWKEFRREGTPPSPQRTNFQDLILLSVEYELDILDA